MCVLVYGIAARSIPPYMPESMVKHLSRCIVLVVHAESNVMNNVLAYHSVCAHQSPLLFLKKPLIL